MTIRENEIIAIDGVSEEYKRRIEGEGVKVIEWMDFRNLTCGYGAAHCST